MHDAVDESGVLHLFGKRLEDFEIESVIVRGGSHTEEKPDRQTVGGVELVAFRVSPDGDYEFFGLHCPDMGDCDMISDCCRGLFLAVDEVQC